MEIIRIKYDKDEIIKKSEASEMCFKCSACSKFCPITSNVSDYDIENSFIVSLYTAEKEKALRDVWMCCTCEKCVTICPQDTDPTHVFTNLKELSYEEGCAPENIYAVVKSIVNTGNAYQISDATNRIREKLGLKPIGANDSVASDLKKLADKSKLKVKE
ncbi:MAG: 4Fe-4S dicluster domain-containing protein [Candidatus Hodarchaeota archaeon]